jgi:hypothetical protein
MGDHCTDRGGSGAGVFSVIAGEISKKGQERLCPPGPPTKGGSLGTHSLILQGMGEEVPQPLPSPFPARSISRGSKGSALSGGPGGQSPLAFLTDFRRNMRADRRYCAGCLW